jgi:hypothetical protein
MSQRMTDKKRFKKALRILQAIVRDNTHGATVEGTRDHRRLKELDAVLDAIRVPGEEPEEEQSDGPDVRDDHQVRGDHRDLPPRGVVHP